MARRKKKQKKSNFVEPENKELKTYTKGAMLGALVGGISCLFLGKKILLGIGIGALTGGYIAYSINKDDSKTTTSKFRNTLKTTFKKPKTTEENGNEEL